jgi:signal transduction histidine kinase
MGAMRLDSRFQIHIQDFLAAQPSALAVWARWSLSTRDEGTWQRLVRPDVQPAADLIVPPVVIPEDLIQPVILDLQDPITLKVTQPGIPETFSYSKYIKSVVIAPIVSQMTQAVVVGFSAEAEARRGTTPVGQLARKLLQELRELRRTQETESLLGVPTAPTHLEDARRGLIDLALEVARCLGADGAKIYLVRRAPKGPVLWRAANTAKEIAPRPVPFSPERGLADYVVRKKTWLLIPCCKPVSESRPSEGIRQEGKNGRGERVVVLAREGRDIDPKAPREKTDDEMSILTYPLETDDQIAGAVSVWRLFPEEGQPEPLAFDEDLDVASLRNFARHLAAACQRLMQLQKAEDHLSETTALAHMLASTSRLQEGYEAVAAGASQLADAACAVLLHHEPRTEASGYLFQSAIWQMEGLDCAPSADPFLISCDLDSSTWEAVVRKSLGERLKPLVYRKLLIATEPGSAAPFLALALFDPPLPERSPAYFFDELLGHFASAFFQAAAQSLRSHVRELASRLVDRLAGPPSLERRELLGPEELLNQAAQLLSETTGANQVLAYTGTPHHLQVRQSFPPVPQLRGFQVAPSSEIARSIAQKKPHRVLAVSKASREIDSDVLGQITTALGWSSARSWLVYPLVHEGRILGLFQLLTHENGCFLGRDHEEIIQQVARHGAWEMYKAARQQALEELLTLINQHAGSAHGHQLGEVLVSLLQKWTERVLFRPNARVLILARSERSGTLIKAGAGKETLDSLENALSSIGERFRSHRKSWDRTEASCLSQFALYGIGEAFNPFGDQHVHGLVCLGDAEAFDGEDQETLSEASRLLSVVLNVERERNDLKVVMGWFRHAVMGPIQGMKSAAEDLIEIARSAGADSAELRRLSSSVAKEAEFLRLWRENQRFYLNDEIKLKRHQLALRPLVERCFSRYRDIVSERGVDYKLAWKPRGDLTLPLDDAAFDVALSNLLDNATRYVFHNQRIEVGVEVANGSVDIWVEDVGHGIDSKAVERILQPQERANPDDPFRMISGQGLGLAMAYKIVEAHSGMLRVKSERYATGRCEDTTSYQVRFTIQLPISQ